MTRTAAGVRTAYLLGYEHGQRTARFVKDVPAGYSNELANHYHSGFLAGTRQRIREAKT